MIVSELQQMTEPFSNRVPEALASEYDQHQAAVDQEVAAMEQTFALTADDTAEQAAIQRAKEVLSDVEFAGVLYNMGSDIRRVRLNAERNGIGERAAEPTILDDAPDSEKWTLTA